MHEMSLCEGVRRIVEDQARLHGARAVSVIRLEIGRFSGVEKPALEVAFDVVMRGSVAEGARLEMIDLPGRGTCYDCMREVEIADRLAPCPECGGGRILPSAGDEMRIKDMEVV